MEEGGGRRKEQRDGRGVEEERKRDNRLSQVTGEEGTKEGLDGWTVHWFTALSSRDDEAPPGLVSVDEGSDRLDSSGRGPMPQGSWAFQSHIPGRTPVAEWPDAAVDDSGAAGCCDAAVLLHGRSYSGATETVRPPGCFRGVMRAGLRGFRGERASSGGAREVPATHRLRTAASCHARTLRLAACPVRHPASAV